MLNARDYNVFHARMPCFAGTQCSDNDVHQTRYAESPVSAVEIEKNGPVTVVTLDRPQARNAVDRPTATALADAFLAFERDEAAHVGVLAGAHGTFCAGADLKALLSGAGGRVNQLIAPKTGSAFEPLGADAPMGPSRMLLGKPVIASIAGYAVAGGLELSLWCDMRVMEEDAVLGVFCRRWGVPLIDGGTIRLPRLIGHSRAMDLILTGRAVGAQEALSMGLVNRVVAKGAGRSEAIRLAEEIAGFPQDCLRHDRLSAFEQWDMSFDHALANEFRHGVEVLSAPDARSGAENFASGKGRGGRFDDL
jgi:enoyl-CoA hydratase